MRAAFSLTTPRYATAKSLLDISLEAWNRVLAVNLTGALICTQAFAPQMIAAGQGGSIVHVASILGHHPQIDMGAYSVGKAGLIMLSRVLAVELAQHRIRSNVVSPGFTRTPANEAAYRDPETAAGAPAKNPSRPGRRTSGLAPTSSPFWPATAPSTSPPRTSWSTAAWTVP